MFDPETSSVDHTIGVAKRYRFHFLKRNCLIIKADMKTVLIKLKIRKHYLNIIQTVFYLNIVFYCNPILNKELQLKIKYNFLNLSIFV